MRETALTTDRQGLAGTELVKKLTDAGTSMEQVLIPLQWSSTAQPLVAKVRSTTGGIYVVDSYWLGRVRVTLSSDNRTESVCSPSLGAAPKAGIG